jgi:ABC-type amino acid transport/signal transduction systems, periplasmic component/domain
MWRATFPHDPLKGLAHEARIPGSYPRCCRRFLHSGRLGQTLKTIKDRGLLSCGVTQGLAGFSLPDDKGNWIGLDVDVCRAIAAAVFNDPSKVKYVPLSAKDRFTALQSGEVDLLSRTTTWTLSRDTSLARILPASPIMTARASW